MAILDADGRYTQVNAALCRMLGSALGLPAFCGSVLFQALLPFAAGASRIAPPAVALVVMARTGRRWISWRALYGS